MYIPNYFCISMKYNTINKIFFARYNLKINFVTKDI